MFSFTLYNIFLQHTVYIFSSTPFVNVMFLSCLVSFTIEFLGCHYMVRFSPFDHSTERRKSSGHAPYTAQCVKRISLYSGQVDAQLFPGHSTVAGGHSCLTVSHRLKKSIKTGLIVPNAVSALQMSRTPLHWPRIGQFLRNQRIIGQCKGTLKVNRHLVVEKK